MIDAPAELVRITSYQWNMMSKPEREKWLESWGLLDVWEAKMTCALMGVEGVLDGIDAPVRA